MITQLIPAIGWTLLHSIWQGALLFLILQPLLHLLRHQRPVVRYWLACSSLLLLLGGMALTFQFQLDSASIDLGAPKVVIGDNTVSTLNSGNPVVDESISPVMVISQPTEATRSTTGATPSIVEFVERNVSYLVGLWALGVLVFILRWCSMLWMTYRLRHRGVEPLPAVWQKRLIQLKERMGIQQSVGLLQSNQVDSPLIIGHLKPIILLPIGLINGLSVGQVEAILAHELAHVRRFDFVVNLVLSGLEVVLFYHPVYWWLVTRINYEREHCCDDIAVAACGSPRLYAQTLLSVEEHRQAGSLALALVGKDGFLLHRIKRICTTSTTAYPLVATRLWLLPLLCAWGMAVIWAAGNPTVANNDLAAFPIPQALLQERESATLSVPTISQAETKATTHGEEQISNTGESQIKEVSSPARPATVVEGPTDESIQPAITRTAVQFITPLLSRDSLPAPSIPQPRSEPTLPVAPAMQLNEAKINELLSEGEVGRAKLREQIKRYDNALNQWKEDVKMDYLIPWEIYLSDVMEDYAEWCTDLRSSARSELAFAIAHHKLANDYEDAIEEIEDRIEEKEDVIERNPEDEIEVLENSVERGEKHTEEHRQRMEIHSSRMALHSLRMRAHSVRMNVHSARMKMHSARMKIHSDKMKSHGLIMQALEAEMRKELIADGLMKSNEEYFRIEIIKDEVLFNGRAIDPLARAQKYRDLLARYGKGEVKDGTFIFEISSRGKNIGRRY